MEIREVNMDFAYGGSFTESSPEAYERLILDVLLGDFPQHEEVELSWEILDPILDYWASLPEPEPYEPGSWGPKAPTSCWRATASAGGDHNDHPLERTTSAKISGTAAGPTQRRSPAQGMVLTLIIVCDESEYTRHHGGQHGGRPRASITDLAGRHRQPPESTCLAGCRGAHRRRDAGRSRRIGMRGAVAAHPASVVRPLLLPDSPVVIWWPARRPRSRAADELAQLAMRRVTDAAASRRPLMALKARASDYTPGDMT